MPQRLSELAKLEAVIAGGPDSPDYYETSGRYAWFQRVANRDKNFPFTDDEPLLEARRRWLLQRITPHTTQPLTRGDPDG